MCNPFGLVGMDGSERASAASSTSGPADAEKGQGKNDTSTSESNANSHEAVAAIPLSSNDAGSLYQRLSMLGPGVQGMGDPLYNSSMPSARGLEGALLATMSSSRTALDQMEQQSTQLAADAMIPLQGQHQHGTSSLLSGLYGYGYPGQPPLAPSPFAASSSNELFSRTMASGNASQGADAASAYSNLLYSGQPSLPYQDSLQASTSASAVAAHSSLLQSMQATPYHNAVASLEQNISDYSQLANSARVSSASDWMTLQGSSLHRYAAGYSHPTYSSSISSSFLPSNDVSASSSGFPSLPASNISSGLPSLPAASIPASNDFSSLTSAASSSGLAQLPSSSAGVSTSQGFAAAQHGSIHRATRLTIPSDEAFLDPVHKFLRSTCIEVFVATQQNVACQGKGARASMVGQVGLRCAFCRDEPREDLARQAICFPTKLVTIFESVRNYQRVHFKACQCISDETKAHYKTLTETKVQDKKPQKFIQAYYAEAGSELGLVETPKGLVFGASPNTSGVPSERVSAIIKATASPANSTEFWQNYSSTYEKPKDLRKFEHLATEGTRRVLIDSRREPSVFVQPQDFPTTSDFDFLLFMQVGPCRPNTNTLRRRSIDREKVGSLSGLCCKHCTQVRGGKGMWFPRDFRSLSDSSLTQSLHNHMMTCNSVPQDVKDAFDELRRLASEHGVTTKRGSKKKFLEKVWQRMQQYYDDEKGK